MHGRPRKAPTDEDQLASSQKAAKLRDLQAQVLHFHHNKIYSKEAMEVSAMLLASNPEHYTGWNYRKLAVQFHLDGLSGNGNDPDTIRSILNEELKVVENALRRNYKSYGAWHHRKWVLSKGHLSTDRELKLLDMFCKSDSRNFHMWNYRRFIAALRKMSDEEEFKYTTGIIEDNFSNYSAWHNRSVCLFKLMEKQERGFDVKENVLKDEYEFVRNALFTDPDDQSGWFYHLWLLDQTLKFEPILIFSWPAHGCNLYLAHDDWLTDQNSFPLSHFQSKTKTLPVILYFSEAVKGVSSSTVTIECEYHTSNILSWRSLSPSSQGFSQAWMTFLEFSDKGDLLEACSVKLTISESLGITSLSGVPLEQCCHISFTITLPSNNGVQSELDANRRISWKEDNISALSEEFQSSFSLLCKAGVPERNNQAASDWRVEIMSNEIANCRELLLSTDCKIGKLILARLLMARSSLVSNGNTTDGAEEQYEDIVKLYSDLKRMDPVHFCYYEDEHSLVLLKQLISDVETFAKHCGQYHESSSPIRKPYSYLRLKGLSLSRIGCMENFLWVQMLDLSDNKLRTVEGLEALQLLVCLKLAHNRFSSFLSLEPLKKLSFLEVLDISHNEIGAHSVDTRRYLCSSPLTQAVDNKWNLDECSGGEKELWESYLLFKDLNLIQLDIAGNQVADGRLRGLVFKVMPTLKWLDGENH